MRNPHSYRPVPGSGANSTVSHTIGFFASFAVCFLQFGEVVEGIDGVQFAGVDEVHEQIAYLGAVLGPIEQRILPATENVP
jgi:hypothetical protein